ncbi:MAG TPA: beta-propeller fold lactonase family protein [Thermoleophilia bacterium]|nr:beta-propeller fold lactonase family protein [Thermoleophilia bacterium]
MNEALSSTERMSRRNPRRRAGRPRRGRRSWPRFAPLIALVIALTLAVAWSAGCTGRATDVTTTVARSDPSSATTTQEGSSSTEGAGGAASTTSSQPTTTTALSNLAPQKLSIKVNPQIANVKITLQDGTTLTGKTPFSKNVPGGEIRVDLTKKGYNPVTRELTLDKTTSLSVWLDPEGLLYESLVRFKCGPNPKQVAFSPDGKEMWVSLLGGYGLEIFEPMTGKKLDQVKLGEHGAVEVIFTRDGRTVYASQMETASVYEIDRATREVKRHFKTGGTWTKVLLLSPDEKTLWASNWVSNNVSEIDLASGKVNRLLKTVVTPRGLYVTPDGKRLFVAGFENGDIQRIDLATGKGKVLFKTGGAMRHMVADDVRGLLYVDDMSTKEVFVVNLASEKVTKLADTDQRPNTMDLSPDGKVLYVSNRGKDNPKTYYIPGPEWGSILAIDTSTGKILDAIVGGNQCTGLDVSPDGTVLAFSDFLDNKIRVYKIPDYDTLAAGDGGRAAAHLKDIVKD